MAPRVCKACGRVDLTSAWFVRVWHNTTYYFDRRSCDRHWNIAVQGLAGEGEPHTPEPAKRRDPPAPDWKSGSQQIDGGYDG